MMKYFPKEKSEFYTSYNKLLEWKKYSLDYQDFEVAVSLRELERDLFLKFDDFTDKWEFDGSKEIFFDLKVFQSELNIILESSRNKDIKRIYKLNNLLDE